MAEIRSAAPAIFWKYSLSEGSGCFFSVCFLNHFRAAHPLCFSLLISPFEMENYRGHYYMHSRSENEYPKHEPFQDRKMPLSF